MPPVLNPPKPAPNVNPRSGSTTAEDTKKILNQVLAYVPAEVVTGYLAYVSICSTTFLGANAVEAGGFLKTPPVPAVDKGLIIGGFIVFLLLAAAYELVMENRSVWEAVLASGAFVVWAYTLGGPFLIWGVFSHKVAAAAVVVTSLLLPMIGPLPVKLFPNMPKDYKRWFVRK